MPRVVGIDHLVLSVGDLARSKAYYGKVLGFLGFKLKHDLGDFAGWSNGKTLFWIAQADGADSAGRQRKHRKGDIGFHHYAFELDSRKSVDALGAFLEENGSARRRSARQLQRRREVLRGVLPRPRRHAARGDALRAGEEEEEGEEEALNSPPLIPAQAGIQFFLASWPGSPPSRGRAANIYLSTISATVFVIGSTISTWSSSCT